MGKTRKSAKVRVLENAGVEIQMEPQTAREALSESIEKWEHILDAISNIQNTIYDDSCPLCAMYRDGEDRDPCEDCPIRVDTDRPNCEETPWLEAKDALFDAYIAVGEMLDYLRSLEY